MEVDISTSGIGRYRIVTFQSCTLLRHSNLIVKSAVLAACTDQNEMELRSYPDVPFPPIFGKNLKRDPRHKW